MSDKSRGMILNPSSRHLRFPSYQALPVSLSSYNTEQNSIFRKIINKGKDLISSVSKSLFSIAVAGFSAGFPRSNDNIQQENKKKEETPCLIETKEMFEIGFKRPGKHFEACKKKRFAYNNIEVQTDIPYTPDYLDSRKPKNSEKLQKKNDSAEELDTKGTDEDDDEVAKYSNGRNVIRKNAKNLKSEKLRQIDEVDEEKYLKNPSKLQENRFNPSGDSDKTRNFYQFFEKTPQNLQFSASFSEKNFDSTPNFLNSSKTHSPNLFLIENTPVSAQKLEKPHQQDLFATPNFKAHNNSNFEVESMNIREPWLLTNFSSDKLLKSEEKKTSENEKKTFENEEKTSENEEKTINTKEPIKIIPETSEIAKVMTNDKIETNSKNLENTNNLFIKPSNDTLLSLPKSSEIPGSINDSFNPLLQKSTVTDKPVAISSEKTADQPTKPSESASSNPFLNINLVKGPEIPFKFGATSYTPAPEIKKPLPATFLGENAPTNNFCSQDMEMDTPSSFNNDGSFGSQAISSGQQSYLCPNLSNPPSSLFSTPLQPIPASHPMKFPEFSPSPFSGIPQNPPIIQPFLSNSPSLFNVPSFNSPAFTSSGPSIYGNTPANNFANTTNKGFSLGVISTIRKAK